MTTFHLLGLATEELLMQIVIFHLLRLTTEERLTQMMTFHLLGHAHRCREELLMLMVTFHLLEGHATWNGEGEGVVGEGGMERTDMTERGETSGRRETRVAMQEGEGSGGEGGGGGRTDGTAGGMGDPPGRTEKGGEISLTV